MSFLEDWVVFPFDVGIKVCHLYLWRKVPLALPSSSAREGNGCPFHSIKESTANEFKVMDSAPPELD